MHRFPTVKKLCFSFLLLSVFSFIFFTFFSLFLSQLLSQSHSSCRYCFSKVLSPTHTHKLSLSRCLFLSVFDISSSFYLSLSLSLVLSRVLSLSFFLFVNLPFFILLSRFEIKCFILLSIQFYSFFQSLKSLQHLIATNFPSHQLAVQKLQSLEKKNRKKTKQHFEELRVFFQLLEQFFDLLSFSIFAVLLYSKIDCVTCTIFNNKKRYFTFDC